MIAIFQEAGRTVYVVPDPRGESETFEAYSLECRDDKTGRTMWVEGIRKDRSEMWPAWRALVEPALTALKGKQP